MKKFSVPSAYTIAVIFIFLAAALTWILPSGSYNYKTESTGKVIPASKVKSYSGPERLLPVPNTYSKIKPSHQGITDILQAPIKGFYGSVN
ncbi:MAG: hypothetical protein K9L78_04290, partial [Victivallales bacterium]|nr:hypothetical protein [Victivallales bacterium]